LSTYGKAVANYVAINLPVGVRPSHCGTIAILELTRCVSCRQLQDEPNSPVKTVKELSVGLGADLEQSVVEAAQQAKTTLPRHDSTLPHEACIKLVCLQGITEEELEKQLQEQLHATVRKSADAGREELRVQVAQASNSLDAGKKVQKNLTAMRQTVATAVIQTKKDIDGYFRQLETLLQDRKEQCIAEAEQRLKGMDEQLLHVNERLAEIEVGCKAAGDASEGPDLKLLHKKPIISEQLAVAMNERWPSKPCTDEATPSLN